MEHFFSYTIDPNVNVARAPCGPKKRKVESVTDVFAKNMIGRKLQIDKSEIFIILSLKITVRASWDGNYT